MRAKIIFFLLIVFSCPMVLSFAMYPYLPIHVIQEKQKKQKTVKKTEKTPEIGKEVEQMPEVKKRPNPKYPENDVKNNTMGVVYLKVLVDVNGKPKEISVAKREEGSVEMETAAIDAAKQWEFTPGKYKGKAVECWVTIPFKFKLQ